MQACVLQDLGWKDMNEIGSALIEPATHPGVEDAAHRKHADGLAAEGGGMLGVFRVVSPDIHSFDTGRGTNNPAEPKADTAAVITCAAEAAPVTPTGIDIAVGRPSGGPKITASFARSVGQPYEVLEIPICTLNNRAWRVRRLTLGAERRSSRSCHSQQQTGPQGQ